MADQDRTNMPAVATGAPSVPEIAPAPTEESAPPLRSKRTRPTRFPCIICGKERLARDVTQLDVMRPSLLDAIRSTIPTSPPKATFAAMTSIVTARDMSLACSAKSAAN